MITNEAVEAIKNNTYGVFIGTCISKEELTEVVAKIREWYSYKKGDNFVVTFGNPETIIDFVNLENDNATD